MSEIKLDDAVTIQKEYSGMPGVGCPTIAEIEAIQDRTLETAAKFVEKSPDRHVSSAAIIRSLKNKRVDEEKVQKLREAVAALYEAISKGREVAEFRACDHAEIYDMVSRFEGHIKDAGGEL